MTPARAAIILESWAAKAKTNDSRKACELAAIALRNSAMAREVLDKSGKYALDIQCIRDSNGVEFFITSIRGGPVIGADTLADALTGLLEKATKGK